ncbi:glycoside hydrolase family 125 protein [Blautia sp. An46]|uniref:glycoside hydrolase family 125 protein n=1 Tax=Blautia sp. An46 TaxID=1965636 RepID=UPI000B398493|nr:glycoside hydrolase family 125 protein [Blautia sp. An46]OUN89750.1 hypothetical protein B5G00_17720 [Blautia sp. An46]
MEKKIPKVMADLFVSLKEQWKEEPELLELFKTCYTNTLDTTVKKMEDGTTHVITGDIPAMWLRDSAAQLRPYIFLAKEDREIREIIAGLVKRQFQYICIDPYANAFNSSPSDDACTYGYLIPSNMFAVVVLGYLEEIEREIFHCPELEKEARELKEKIHYAIESIGKTATQEFGVIYAYETDGYGMYNLMDDANVPSLLAMDYLGYPSDPDVGENTRRFLLSNANPYYYEGKKAAGIGSPHTPSSYIWHISMAIRGLTSKEKEEKKRVLRNMADTTGGKGVMHEGFHVDDDTRYTREWFSWANAMYAELFLDCSGYRLKIK